MRRPLVALATVVLVITPISWILLHQPQSDQADASVPYVSRDDDTYITASTEPAAKQSDTPPPATPGAPSTTPTNTPRTPKPSPSVTPDDTVTPTGGPTARPTDGPTDGPTNRPTGGTTRVPTSAPTDGTTTVPADEPPADDETTAPTPTRTPPSDPTPTEPPDDGNMTESEQELFTLIDRERQNRGCAPLDRNSNLTGNARSEAADRADSGNMTSSGASKASTGGDSMSAGSAFDRLKAENSGTLFNCGLDELGVGRGSEKYRDGICLPLLYCPTKTRVAWVVDFN